MRQLSDCLKIPLRPNCLREKMELFKQKKNPICVLKSGDGGGNMYKQQPMMSMSE